MRLKLAIDHYVGGCLAWMLNIGARLIAFIWRRDHTLQRPPRAILFLKFTGMGSIARAAFLIEAMRQRHPGARIGFACFPGCAGLVRLYPQIDDVLVIRDQGLFRLGWDTLRLIAWALRRKADLVVDLEVHSKYSSVVTGLTLARDRAGFGGVTSRFRRGLYTHLVFWNPTRRVDLAYRQLGRAIGVDAAPHWVHPVIPGAAEREADALFAQLGIQPGARILGVNPNTSELRLERRWGVANFAGVVNSLPPDEPIHVLLLGSPAEHDYVTALHQAIGTARARVHNIAGAISFSGFVAVLSRLTLLLTNDSGPLHVAAALGTPTVSIWGPTHPAHYAPHGAQHVKFYRPLYCSPCVHTTDVPPCGGDNQCLIRLDWRRVARTVCGMMSVNPPRELEAGLVARPRDAEAGVPVFGYWRRVSVALPVVETRAT